MASRVAVRVLAALAVCALHCGSVGAMPVNAMPADEPMVLMQDHWPAAQWVEPTTFVINGMSGLDEPSLEEPVPAADPSDRAARLLALWIRLAAAADRARDGGSLLEIELPASLGDDAPRRTLAALASVRNAEMRAVVPAAANTMGWDIGSVSLAAASGRSSFDAHVSIGTGSEANAISLEVPPPLRSIQVMPWIALGLALLGIGWIGWRTAG